MIKVQMPFLGGYNVNDNFDVNIYPLESSLRNIFYLTREQIHRMDTPTKKEVEQKIKDDLVDNPDDPHDEYNVPNAFNEAGNYFEPDKIQQVGDPNGDMWAGVYIDNYTNIHHPKLREDYIQYITNKPLQIKPPSVFFSDV